MPVTVVLRGVEGLAETEGRSRWRWLEGRGWAGGGWLVMHCANSPRRGSRDSYPRPIIDRSLEKRRTHCAHRASYLAPYTTGFSSPWVGVELSKGGGMVVVVVPSEVIQEACFLSVGSLVFSFVGILDNFFDNFLVV